MFAGRVVLAVSLIAADTAVMLAVLVGEQLPNETSLVTVLLNYGVLGVFAVLLVLGRIEGPKRADKAEARAEAAEERERALHHEIRAEVIPAMIRWTETAARVLERDRER